MTGEITLSGLVLPVGGIREKALAARRHGIRTFILPQLNHRDLDELPAEVRATCASCRSRRSRTSGCCRQCALSSERQHGQLQEDCFYDSTFVPASESSSLAPALCVVFYISGHGFGHAIRQIEIINALPTSRPTLRIVIRTTAPAGSSSAPSAARSTLLAGEMDTGVVQIDSLRPTSARPSCRARRFTRASPSSSRGKPHCSARMDATLVVADAPPLACAAAAAPVSLGRLRELHVGLDLRDVPRAARRRPSSSRRSASVYARAAGAGGCRCTAGSTRCRSIVDLPFVARRGRCRSATEFVGHLGLPAERPLALVSFGGYGLAASARSPRLPTQWDVVCHRQAWTADLPAALHRSRGRYLRGRPRLRGSRRAVDVVITKPGYGIISDCVANGTAMLYTSRGRFAEYEVMVARDAALPALPIHRCRTRSETWRDGTKRSDAAADCTAAAGASARDRRSEVVAEMIRRAGLSAP